MRKTVPVAVALPQSPTVAASVGLSNVELPISPTLARGRDRQGSLTEIASAQSLQSDEKKAFLELRDGHVFEGLSFGAEKSVSGELVFQTGMVGYPESVTDPSYRGQILVMTFPLVGNYGVPSREDVDEVWGNLPKYFESDQIHIAGLVVASYSGEQYSHHLATSSLGTWLKEQGVPAIYGVDTRALTKIIREEGSMLGRLLQVQRRKGLGLTNGWATNGEPAMGPLDWRSEAEEVEWHDQNQRNLVHEGMA